MRKGNGKGRAAALVLAVLGAAAAVEAAPSKRQAGAMMPIMYAMPGPHYPIAMAPVAGAGIPVTEGEAMGGAGLAGGGGLGAGAGAMLAAPHKALLGGGYSQQMQGGGDYSQQGQHAGGGGFQHQGGFANKNAAAASSGYHRAGAYMGDDRQMGDKMAHNGYYNDIGMGQKAIQKGGLYENGQTFGRGGKLKLEEALNNGYKKGHHSNGFHSSYHKDESGHDVKFYDDDHDEGLHLGARNFGDYYGARGLSSAQGEGNEGRYLAGARGQQQHYGAGVLEDAKRGQHNTHVNEGFYGHKDGFGQEAAGGMGGSGGGNYGSAHNFNRGGAGSQSMGYHHMG